MRLLIYILIYGFLGSLFAQKPQGVADWNVFYHPEKSGFAEVYITLEAATLTFRPSAQCIGFGDPDQGGFMAGAEITVILKEGENILAADKYNLITDVLKDTSDLGFTLSGINRMAVSKGNYDLEIQIRDMNDRSRVSIMDQQELKVEIPSDETFLSDIELLDTIKAYQENHPFLKNNRVMIPNVLRYYPTLKDQLIAYSEFYDPDGLYKDKDLLMVHRIEKEHGGVISGKFQSYKKVKGMELLPCLAVLNIRDLPSGTYRLIQEMRDRENNLLCSGTAIFFRSNRLPVDDINSIALLNTRESFVSDYKDYEVKNFLRALAVIEENKENRIIENLLNHPDAELRKNYLFNYFQQKNLLKPEKAFQTFLAHYNVVQENFKTHVREGFHTDRGRVYLQYGPPMMVDEVNNDNRTKPFEIWNYDRLKNGETAIIFVFVNYDGVGNDYQLIHSNSNNEFSEPNWKAKLEHIANEGPLDGRDPTMKNTDMGTEDRYK